MTPLRRHQLARLSAAGWATILARPWDPQARECLAHWARYRLPLVVTRQPHDATAQGLVALGLPAPERWNRRRLALQVPRAAVFCLGEFPRLAEVLPLLLPSAHCAVCKLVDALDACQTTSRVFGSYGWQAISGMHHVRSGSDLDLSVTVDGASHADAVTQVLLSFDAATEPRIDGELLFNDGAAVAWREWIEWRAGRVRAVLVKRMNGVSLERDAAWCERVESAELPT
jgi:phosphoribosyl-dephospho-CoA transferase